MAGNPSPFANSCFDHLAGNSSDLFIIEYAANDGHAQPISSGKKAQVGSAAAPAAPALLFHGMECMFTRGHVPLRRFLNACCGKRQGSQIGQQSYCCRYARVWVGNVTQLWGAARGEHATHSKAWPS